MRDKQRSSHHLTLICMNLPVGIWAFIRVLFTSEPKDWQECLFPLCIKGNAHKSHFLSRLGKTIVSLAKFLTSGLLITNSCQTTNLYHYFNFWNWISFGAALLLFLSLLTLYLSLMPEFSKVDNKEWTKCHLLSLLTLRFCHSRSWL